MKHSWQEQADGTARCRRCPAVRYATTKVYRTRRVLEQDAYDGLLYYEIQRDSTAAVRVDGAHPSKCGRSVKG